LLPVPDFCQNGTKEYSQFLDDFDTNGKNTGLIVAVTAKIPKNKKYPVRSILIRSFENTLKSKYNPNNTALPTNGNFHASSVDIDSIYR
jgi:hypothetical protein